jgi:phage recombination protein Bet
MELTKQITMSEQEIDSLVQAGIIPKGTPVEQIKIFAAVCRERNLSPFSKQIYLIPRGGKYTIQTSIDGLRAIAERTGKYIASGDYLFNDNRTQFQLIQEGVKHPLTATVTITKGNGVQGQYTATANWDSYYPGESLGTLWRKFPFLMLGKCAEALALRKAFPEAIGSLYIEEEMQQAEIETTPVKIETVKAELSETVIKTISEFQNPGALLDWSKNQTHLHTNPQFRELVKVRRAELQKGVAL